jgi:hypothetical protein
MARPSCKQWLKDNHPAVLRLVERVERNWRKRGVMTRRNWWDVVCPEDGQPIVIDDVTFPVLRPPAWREAIRHLQWVRENMISVGFAIAYDNDSRHHMNGHGWPWSTERAAKRALVESSTYQARGGRVVQVALVPFED